MPGTKLRAPYQRRKGRDLDDLHEALIISAGFIQRNALPMLSCVYEVCGEPNRQRKKIYLQNMEIKMQDDEVLGDITGLIRPTEKYDQQVAYKLVRVELLEKLLISDNKL